jgi:acetoin utilization deacetylase AcuC-like enzyme
VEPYPALDRPEGKRRLWGLLQASGLAERLVPVRTRPATDDELLPFHTAAYIDRIRSMASTGGGDAGESARFGRNGFEIARLAAGGCIAAVEAVLQRRVENAYALVRPSGHHAEPDRGRGFCIFGNIVLAVEHARCVHGVKRIAVVDWDVHHGNGTQIAYYADPDVLTISLHQEACYPVDSGDLSDTGDGPGRGANINISLPPGSGDGAYRAAFDRVVIPAVTAFRPELVVVASGYDAAASDPLGRMLCHSGTYRAMAAAVVQLARSWATAGLSSARKAVIRRPMHRSARWPSLRRCRAKSPRSSIQCSAGMHPSAASSCSRIRQESSIPPLRC